MIFESSLDYRVRFYVKKKKREKKKRKKKRGGRGREEGGAEEQVEKETKKSLSLWLTNFCLSYKDS